MRIYICECRKKGVMIDMEPLKLILIIGANIFGVYALYKICQVSYWFIKEKMSRKEEL